mmetsp:Transcript_6678/g.17465  ORF Transcript_6678/g.17465 Transcript_6678/m.17465 type:complete len:99 (+) Transcript_6678:167-463(+)
MAALLGKGEGGLAVVVGVVDGVVGVEEDASDLQMTERKCRPRWVSTVIIGVRCVGPVIDEQLDDGSVALHRSSVERRASEDVLRFQSSASSHELFRDT